MESSPTNERPLIKMDLHCHTEASLDSATPLTEIPDRCLECGIHVQAITDHGEVWGAQKLKAWVEEKAIDLQIIVGEEILTNQGELIGLFLEEKVPTLLSPQETADRIHDQGGLVLLPHGFDPYKVKRLRPHALESIQEEIDIVEAFNTHLSNPRYNRGAYEWALEHDKPVSAGSDAHRLHDVGSAWVEIPKMPVHNPAQLLVALEKAEPTGMWTFPLVTAYHNLVDRIQRLFD